MFFDESIFGIDITGDGKADLVDDLILMDEFEAEERRWLNDKQDEEDEIIMAMLDDEDDDLY